MASNSKNTLAIRVDCDASVEKVWARIADWSSQGEWMLATRVWVTSEISEAMNWSDRIVVMSRGRIIGIYKPKDVTREDIMSAAEGTKEGELV